MTDYIRNVIIIGVAASIVMIALPKNTEKSGLYVRQLSAFVLLAVMLAPLKDLSQMTSALKAKLDGIQSTGESENLSDSSAVIGMTAEGICSYIVELCERKYGFEKGTTDVKLIIDDSENLTISEIQVLVGASDSSTVIEAEDYLEEVFGCEVHVFAVRIEKY